MTPALFNLPRPWSNQSLVLYHGTLARHVPGIKQGVQPSRGRLNTDFGPGFYTSTSLRQAKSWAWALAQAAQVAGNGQAQAAVVHFHADRNALASLEALCFVRGDYEADDFWSLVFYCRQGAVDHSRAGPTAIYDVVYGPVAAFWQQRSAMLDSEQISFHTARGVTALTYVRDETV